MKAEIVSIGDELLIGQTINTNASFIGQKLTEIGIEVKRITTISDHEEDIISAITSAEKRADVIIATGGLGPTHDDVTKKAFVRYFKSKLILNKTILKKIQKSFKERGIVMSPINEEQALVPDDASIVENKMGTAPGLRFQKNNRDFFVLPGVPSEMKTMVEDTIIPLLKKKSTLFIKRRMIKTTGVAESTLFEKMGNISELEKIVKIAFLPKSTGVEIRLTATNPDEMQCSENLAQAESIIRQRINEHIWGFDDQNLEDVVAQLLFEQHKTIAIAESCTGGMITDRLTNVSGSSTYLKQAIIAYSIESKVNTLGMKKQFIDQLGEVSAEVAIEMAKKVREMSNTDFGLATTGLLGPNGGISKTPVGLIYVAVSDAAETIFHRLIFKRDRIFNKQRATQMALDLLRRQLLKSNRQVINS